MMNIFEIIAGIALFVSLISFFAIVLYLRYHKLYTAWQLRSHFFWPILVVEYRDHTRATYGRTGIWYYVIVVSAPLTLILGFALFLTDIFWG